MKVAFVFPGYGSQFVGMAKELYDDHRIVQEYFEEAANCLNENFVKLCFASSDAVLSKSGNAYVSLFLVGSALFDLVKTEIVKPDVVAGYNQGEYTALFAAGAMSFPDGLYLLTKYATFYEEALANMNVQVARIDGLSEKEVTKLCAQMSDGEHRVFIAVYYDETTHYVSGHTDVMARVRNHIDDLEGVTLSPAALEIGLHSPLMQEVYDNFKIYLEKVDCKDLQIPCLSGPGGRVIGGCNEVKEYVSSHILGPIEWTGIVDSLEPYDCIIEIGPGTTLRDMLTVRYPDKKIYSVNNKEDVETLKEAFPSSSDGETTDG